MATMLTHAITLMALVLFFALKYRQAKRKFNSMCFGYYNLSIVYSYRRLD